IEKRFGGNKETKKEDINLKFLRSLPTEWRTLTLIWRNKTDLEEQSLDDLFNSLKIYEDKVKSSSSASTSTQNIALVSSNNTDSTNEPVSDVASVSAASVKIHVSALPNVDTLNDDDLKEMDLKWKGQFARECRSPKDTRRNDVAEPQRRNVPAEEEPTNYALMAFTSLSSSSSDNEPIYDRYQSGDGYHAVPPPYIGTFMPPKPDLVFHNALNVNETDYTAFNVELSPTKPNNDLSHTHRTSAPIIKDWLSDSEDDSKAAILQNTPSFVQPNEQVKTPRPFVKIVEPSIPTANTKTTILKPKSNGNRKNRKACFVLLTKSKLVPITAARPVTTVASKPYETRPKQAKTIVTKPPSPYRRNINCSPSQKANTFPPKVTAARAPMVNAVKGKWEWKPKCPILDHVSHNTSASMTLKRFDYNDALGRSKSDKGVIDSGCSRHMIRNMSYLFDFEEINGGYVAFGGNPKGGRISGKATSHCGNQSNPSAGVQEQFDAEKAREDSVQQYVLFPVWSSEFKDFSDNSINEVNAADSLVPAIRQISTNNTNTFSAAGPTNTAVSPTHGKYSYVNTSQNPDDPNMQELEDITYSDDEEDVGAEADFTNLETYITVSPIPTTRVHKDHPVTQIIGDLSSATQTRSMTRVAKDQVKQKPDGIFISHDKYVAEILRKFGMTDGESTSTPIDTEKYLLKDPDGEDVDMHTYRSMIGSLMYLTSSRPNIMFAVCACACFQVTPKASHLHAVKRIFTYLKGKPHLGLWYPKDSPLNLVAYSDSDYA
nr:hypothetical protein [Tanacetum cinerariifolium]